VRYVTGNVKRRRRKKRKTKEMKDKRESLRKEKKIVSASCPGLLPLLGHLAQHLCLEVRVLHQVDVFVLAILRRLIAKLAIVQLCGVRNRNETLK
jgi:hypothetical protein